MSETFTPSEYDEGYPDGIEAHFWHAARHSFLDRMLEDILEPGELALDIGCGAGVYVAHARGSGMNLHGVEQAPAPVPEPMHEYVMASTALKDLPLEQREQVKVALLLDVIEHIEDRHEFLNSVNELLPNCDHLLVTVPARQEIWSNYDQHWGHHLRYNRTQLRAELEDAGFAVESCNYYFNWVYLVSLLMRPLGIKRETGFRSPRRNPLVLIFHRLLAAVTIIENRIAPGWLPGSTILCLARRRTR